MKTYKIAVIAGDGIGPDDDGGTVADIIGQGGVAGSADDAAAAFAAGTLEYNEDIRCAHHDQEHGEGEHHCGENGCGEHHCH